MTPLRIMLVLLTAVSGCTYQHHDLAESELGVMSFNIRNGKAKYGENRWDKRKPLVYDVIKTYGLDIVGVQEAFRFQMDDLIENLPQYGEIGEGRDAGTANEYSAILYHTDRFLVASSDTLWLSDTTEVVSKHWGNHHHCVHRGTPGQPRYQRIVLRLQQT